VTYLARLDDALFGDNLNGLVLVLDGRAVAILVLRQQHAAKRARAERPRDDKIIQRLREKEERWVKMRESER
jgi:hypothetical protein